MTTSFRNVLVVGAGTMGNGIAQVCAQAGLQVSLLDASEAALSKGLKAIETSTSKLVEKQKLSADDRTSTLARIRSFRDLSETSRDFDLAIEAIPERMDWKLELFRKLDAHLPSDAVLGTNTSSLSVTELANASAHPERVVGLHFFNPVPLMELLEIVLAMQTSDQTRARAQSFAELLNKKPVFINDAPGFATSRLGVILGCEAIRMLESGVAKASDIDTAMRLGYKHPMGPLELTDMVGLDVRLNILDHLHREVGEQFRPPALLRKMVRAGYLGKKSGRGFYRYDEKGNKID